MMRGPLVWLLASAVLLPFPILVLLSLAQHWPWPELLPTHLQMRQWQAVFKDAQGLKSAILLSVGLGVAVSGAATALGFASSRSVARHPQQHRLLTLVYLPFAVSPVVLGVSLLYIFLRLHLAGNVAGVMLAQLVFAYAYAVILSRTFWNRRVAALEELAVSLGANRWQVWLRVLMPMARPLLVICLFQTFLISWFDYALAQLIGNAQVATLTVSLYQYFVGGDTRLAATCSLLLIAPPLAALALNHRLLSATIAAPLEDLDE